MSIWLFLSLSLSLYLSLSLFLSPSVSFSVSVSLCLSLCLSLLALCCHFRGLWGGSRGRWLHPHGMLSYLALALPTSQKISPQWGPSVFGMFKWILVQWIISLIQWWETVWTTSWCSMRKVLVPLLNKHCTFPKAFSFLIWLALRLWPLDAGNLVTSFVFQSGYKGLCSFISGAVDVLASYELFR
jgi:hypothetical protein